MFNKTMIWTTFIAALFTTGALKFLHFFNFIQWSPVGWGKNGYFSDLQRMDGNGCFYSSSYLSYSVYSMYYRGRL